MPEAGHAEATGLVLGFDHGGRRIGVAIGQAITASATALAVVRNSPQGPDWASIDQIIRQWQPTRLVIGLPLTMDGDHQNSSKAAQAFGRALADRYRLPVFEQDERLSSRIVGGEFALARSRGEAKRKPAALLDAQAARLIVERFLAGSTPTQANSNANSNANNPTASE